MLVGADDLVAEQRAHLLRHRLHLALLHPRGRLHGLGVSVAAAPEERRGLDGRWRSCVRVEAGLAIDALGRELYVGQRQLLDVSGLASNRHFWDQLEVQGAVRRAVVVLRHAVLPHRRTAGAQGLGERHARLRDGFVLELAAERPPRVGALALLAGGIEALWAEDRPAPLALAELRLKLAGETVEVTSVVALGAPRLLQCNMDGGALVAVLDAPVRPETVGPSSVSLRVLEEGQGWRVQEAQLAVSGDGMKISVTPMVQPIHGALCRLLLVGSGPTPILGREDEPLAGSVEAPGGPAGADAVGMGRWGGGAG